MQLASATEQRLRRLVEIFLEENSKVNLSAFRTEEQCWVGNVLDSLAAIETFSKLETRPSTPLRTGNPKLRVLDLGTGGGFPLLPLAIMVPDATFVGLDATQKKVDAVQRIADAMELKNIEMLAGRAEELGHEPDYRETFDLVLSRAVAPINTLLEYCAPFVKPGGSVVLWKSVTIDQELEESLLARAELSCHLQGTHEYDLGEQWGKRQLLLFEKTAFLSRKYPRGVGIPKKDPLR